MNLDQLRAFADVAELGSFTAAAERRGLTQPAVSLQVRQLERRLGVPLVERLGRSCRPTRAGLELLDYARSIQGLTDSATQAMSRHRSGGVERVRIGTGATACIYLLPPVLKELRRRHPALEITVSTGNTSEFVRALEENTIDIGFVTLPASSRILEVTPVLDDDFVLVAPREMSVPDPVAPADLRGRPVILFEPGGRTRRLADEWLAAMDVKLTPVMSLGSVEAIKELVGAGLGCAILPGLAVSGGRLPAGVVVRRLAPPLKRTLAVVIRRDKRLHRGLAETVRALTSLGRDAGG